MNMGLWRFHSQSLPGSYTLRLIHENKLIRARRFFTRMFSLLAYLQDHIKCHHKIE